MSVLEEDTFLEALGQDQVDIDALLASVKSMYEESTIKKADTQAQLLLDKLIEKGRADDAVNVVDIWCQHHLEDSGCKAACLEKLLRIYNVDPERQILVRSSGFEVRKVNPLEAMKRFRVLCSLAPNTLVYDFTWGFGVVQEVQPLEGKVRIDFEGKPGHHLGLAYAAETLDLLKDDHLFARRYNDPEGFQELVDKDPGEIIIIALRSFGNRPVPIIQEYLVPRIVPEAKWKKFWDTARKKIKQHPMIEFPSKRSESIVLLDKEKQYDDEWFAALKRNTDMESLLKLIAEFQTKGDPRGLTDDQKAILMDRLGFVIHGAEGKQSDLLVKSLLMAANFNLHHSEVKAGAFINDLFIGDNLLKTLSALSSKETKGLLPYLISESREETVNALLVNLNALEYNAFGESINQLIINGQEEAVAGKLKELWNSWAMSVVVTQWLAANADKVEQWSIGTRQEMVPRILSQLEEEYNGELLKSWNQLRGLFSNKKWLQETMETMDDRQRRIMTQGIKDSSAWPSLDQASVLGHIVKLYPEMQYIVSGESEKSKATASRRGPVTSLRSYRMRERQLKKIIQEDIPANSKEIGVAREYGDLRENFEYKAAKEQQRLLMQRQGELEKMLRVVTPSTFQGFSAEVAGVATGVQIKYDDGETELFYIMGEWDSDEALNIISCESRMARTLAGKISGDRETVPSANGVRECVVEAVTPLPEHILAWAADEHA